jgi:putative endonuclease
MGAKEKPFYWIYILRMANGSYYTGYARDLAARFRTHRRGRGARITRSFSPVCIAACWRLYSGRAAAMRIEAWIKGRSRQAKQSLVDRPETLKELLRRQGREEPVEPAVPPQAAALGPVQPPDPIDQF